MPQIDLVLVSHSHYDHLDAPTLAAFVAAQDPLIVTPLGNDSIFRRAAPRARIISIDWDEATTCGSLSVTALWSSIGLRAASRSQCRALVWVQLRREPPVNFNSSTSRSTGNG